MGVAVGVSVVTGLLNLLAPVQISDLFGVTLDDTGASLARLLGASISATRRPFGSPGTCATPPRCGRSVWGTS